FLLAGLLLLTVVLALGDTLPKRLGDWRTQAIVGVLLLSGGNAFVVWAEQYTASGIASIFVVTVALWMAFFDAIIPGGSGDLNWRVVTGLLLGFVGTALLVGASPVIAVLLGWLIMAEPVTARTFLAMALILGAVVWIQFSHKLGRSGSPASPAPHAGPPVRQTAS